MSETEEALYDIVNEIFSEIKELRTDVKILKEENTDLIIYIQSLKKAISEHKDAEQLFEAARLKR